MVGPRQRIEELERLLCTGPNIEAMSELLVLRSRIEGLEVYLEALDDRTLWNQYPSLIQDKAIEVVSGRLGQPFEHVSTLVYECQGLSHRLACFRHKKTRALLNLIPGGRYLMGSGDLDSVYQACRSMDACWKKEWNRAETPQHEVLIEPMLIGVHPVSQLEWDSMGGGDNRYRVGEDLPMESRSWKDCQQWLEKVGDGLRLPSEAEWEFACRAGSKTLFFWGDAMDPEYCWYRDNSGRTRPLGEHLGKHNAFGLVDMLGQIGEWCEDDWTPNYENARSDARPQKDRSSYRRVFRGGGWSAYGGTCRSGMRSPGRYDYRGPNVGLRLARNLIAIQ